MLLIYFNLMPTIWTFMYVYVRPFWIFIRDMDHSSAQKIKLIIISFNILILEATSFAALLWQLRKQCKAAIYSNIKLTRISNVWYSNCWLTKLLWILWNNKSISRVRHWIQKNITFYLWHCWEILFYLSTQRRYISSVVETIKLGTF